MADWEITIRKYSISPKYTTYEGTGMVPIEKLAPIQTSYAFSFTIRNVTVAGNADTFDGAVQRLKEIIDQRGVL